MATIRAFTSLEQSKILTEILPIESADHFHIIGHLHTDGPRYEVIRPRNEVVETDKYWPCWSLAALLNILPADKIITMGITIEDNKKIFSVGYMDKQRMYQSEKENMVDACYEMILKLHELKML